MKKRTGALLLALVMLFGLMAPAASAVETEAVEAVYLGVVDFTTLDTDEVAEDDFVHRFFVDGEEEEYTVATGADEDYAIQNKLMEGYIYNIVVDGGVVTDVELQDKGTITMGVVTGVGESYVDDELEALEIDVDDETIDVTELAFYEIESPVQPSGAVITEIDFEDIELDDTVKVTENAVYKTFVAEEYTAPVEGTPGEATLKNFLTTALQPVGTALYVFGGCWDWEDDASSNQSTTIGIPQEWIDFFQSQDTDYHYKKTTNGSYADSYYTSNRGWNQYYYAGVDCSAYVAWVAYNTLNSESGGEGFVGSSTNQAQDFADNGWGTVDRGEQRLDDSGNVYFDKDGDSWRDFDTTDFKVGDIFSDNGHVWICLGVCDDGSMVFMHSTPSTSTDGKGEGGGIQISALDVEMRKDCEAYELACHYMETYYPQWTDRYTPVVRGESYIQVWDDDKDDKPETTDDIKPKKAGRFSWDLEDGPLSDPDGYADMTPAEILADIFGEFSGEAVYLGVKDFTRLDTDKIDEDDFTHLFYMDGEVVEYAVATGKEESYAIQNKLMEGYIYNITGRQGKVAAVELLDKGTITMGTVEALGEGTITVDGETYEVGDVYEITTAAGGATVTEADALEVGDTVKITDNAIYKAFVAEEYTSPITYTPGQTTLRNFLAAALHPVGTALYVYGGCWDWQDDLSSNQSMTIGIPQSWIDFFQSNDETYHYKATDADGNWDLSYYTSNRGWNQYYYAGVDCSAYVGWVVYNTINDESTTNDQSEGYVGSSTRQAKRFALTEEWGTLDQGVVEADGKHHYDDSTFRVGDVFSMNGHVWICLGTCADGSIVFMHSTPSENNGAGIQISAVGESKDCEAYQLASHYMETYYPAWGERYDALLKSFDGYTITTGDHAGKFTWDLSGESLMSDPDGFADMTPAEILANLYGEKDLVVETEAVYTGIKNFATERGNSKDTAEANFLHRFVIDGVESVFDIEDTELYALENKLMEGYIYHITVTNGVVTAVSMADECVAAAGEVEYVDETSIEIDGEEYDVAELPVYEIQQGTLADTTSVVAGAEIEEGDTVKITDKAVYKTFVAEKYEAPVAGTPGELTLKNFLTTALQPVGTGLYVYGGAWDWQDSYSSLQSMTIGIPQSWIDFFQRQDTEYTYRDDSNVEGSYYTSPRGWNQYYYAGVDCSAYVGWVVYNVQNTESGTVNTEGHVGSSTKQAKNFAAKGWGTWDHDTANVELKVGDVVSMSGHVWICLGVCEDGSIVFMHSTPSNSKDGAAGGGIQIASLNPNGDKDTDCEAYELACYYMETYYPQWTERYNVDQKNYSSYMATSSNSNAGVLSWYLDGREGSLLTDPDGYADMTPAEILMDIFGDNGIPSAPASKPSVRPSAGSGDKDDEEPVAPVTPVEPEATFKDVPETHWANAAVEFVAKEGLFNGVSADSFAPSANTTRAQLMTVLARHAGADTDGDALAKGMAWAKENGISDGTNGAATITREQLATMLYRYAILKGMDVSVGENTNILSYEDALEISEYAVPAMQWACGAGIINGVSASQLDPTGTATRAQVAAMMQRFCAL